MPWWLTTTWGQRSFLLAVENMKHFDQTGTSTITNPTLEVYSKGKPEWEVSAASGRVMDGNSRIELRTDVNLASLTSDLLLTTTAMDIYPARKLAKSNKPVQVRDGLSNLRAGAMTVDMNSRMITMRRRVTGNHSAQ
jgi:LPS export ABC transporter protein LptC